MRPKFRAQMAVISHRNSNGFPVTSSVPLGQIVFNIFLTDVNDKKVNIQQVCRMAGRSDENALPLKDPLRD